MRVYGINTCGSVRNAKKFLDLKGIKYEYIDLKKEVVPIETIQDWLTVVDLKVLLNTKGLKYRNLGLSKLDLNDKEKIEWLAKENLLIKRPVIVNDDGEVIVGFDEQLYEMKF